MSDANSDESIQSAFSAITRDYGNEVTVPGALTGILSSELFAMHIAACAPSHIVVTEHRSHFPSPKSGPFDETLIDRLNKVKTGCLVNYHIKVPEVGMIVMFFWIKALTGWVCTTTRGHGKIQSQPASN